MSKTSSAVHRRYNEKAYDRVEVTIPKGRKEDLQVYTDAHHTSIRSLANDYFRTLLGMTEEEWKTRKPTETEDSRQEDEV